MEISEIIRTKKHGKDLLLFFIKFYTSNTISIYLQALKYIYDYSYRIYSQSESQIILTIK